MKKLYLLSIITLTTIALIYSCSTEEEDTTPPPSVVATPEPEPPAPTQYTLTVTAGEGGSVSTEGGTYDEGTEITITATPDEGYEFVDWSDGEDSISRNINISENITLTANFRSLTLKRTLEIKSNENGTVEPYGYGNFEFDIGANIQLNAIPNDGFGFYGWLPFGIKNVGSENPSDDQHSNLGYFLSSNSLDLEITEWDGNPDSSYWIKPFFYWVYDINSIEISNSTNSYDNRYPTNIFKNLSEISPPSIQYPNDGAILDYNNDGYLDVIHSNTDYNSSYEGIRSIFNVKFYSGDQNGYLTLDQNLSNNFPGFEHGYKSLVGDFDNNGFQDVFFMSTGVDNQCCNNGDFTFFLMNNGDSSFEQIVMDDLIGYWHTGTSADFDNDGNIEILIFDLRINRDSFIIEYNNGVFEYEKFNIPPEMSIFKLASELKDINNDGYLDLFLGGQDQAPPPYPNDSDDYVKTLVWYGSENGFDEYQELPLTGFQNRVLDFQFFDFDNDGDDDIIVNRTIEYNTAYIQFIRNDTNGFTDVTDQYDINGEYSQISTGAVGWILVGDFNKDGVTELLINEFQKFDDYSQWVWEFRDGSLIKVDRVD